MVNNNVYMVNCSIIILNPSTASPAMALILPGVAINVAVPSLKDAAPEPRPKRRAEALPGRRGPQVAGDLTMETGDGINGK